MASFPRKCPKCRERCLNLVTEPYEDILEHDARQYQIAIPSLTLLACSACGNRILPDEADDRVSEELRRVAGLLSPSDIRAQRIALSLTQKKLALDLDIAEETLCRWETGKQIQQRAFDKLLRAYFALPELRNYLSHRAPRARTAADLDRQSIRSNAEADAVTANAND